MLKGATNASTNLENISRPQTGNTTTAGGKASKAHSAVYRDNCANSNLLNKRNNAALVNSNEFYAKHAINPLTVSHKSSIGGGIMSKKKRDRNMQIIQN